VYSLKCFAAIDCLISVCKLRTNANHHILSNLVHSTFVPMVAFGVALSKFGRISCCLPR
jgi:hypothetical protein